MTKPGPLSLSPPRSLAALAAALDGSHTRPGRGLALASRQEFCNKPTPRRLYLPIAALLALLILAPSLLYPFGRDQSVFAYVGRVIAEGGMPFRDAWDLKPPGIYALYGLMAWLGPEGHGQMLVVRIVDVVFAAATAVLLALLARRWGRREAGWAAGAWYAGLYLQGGYWSLAQAEAFANPLLVGAACLLLFGRGAPAWLAAGVLTGLAATLKITTVVPVAVFVLWELWRQPGGRMRKGLAFGAGGMVSVGAALLWLQTGDALAAYLDIQRGFVAPYTRLNPSGPQDLLSGVARWALQMWGPLLLAAAWWSRDRSIGIAAAAFGAAVLAVVAQSKFFLYHWETVLPWLALLAGFGSATLLERIGPRRAAMLALALPLLWATAVNWSAYRDATLHTAGLLPREQWLKRFTSGDDYSFLATERAAEYVREHTAPGDRVLVWGFEPSVYLLSRRRPPTRFFFNVPVAVPFSPAAWKEEFLADLHRDPPALFLVVQRDAIPWANGLTADSAEQLQSWRELSGFLDRRYRLDAHVEDFRVYRPVLLSQPIRVRGARTRPEYSPASRRRALMEIDARKSSILAVRTTSRVLRSNGSPLAAPCDLIRAPPAGLR